MLCYICKYNVSCFIQKHGSWTQEPFSILYMFYTPNSQVQMLWKCTHRVLFVCMHIIYMYTIWHYCCFFCTFLKGFIICQYICISECISCEPLGMEITLDTLLPLQVNFLIGDYTSIFWFWCSHKKQRFVSDNGILRAIR